MTPKLFQYKHTLNTTVDSTAAPGLVECSSFLDPYELTGLILYWRFEKRFISEELFFRKLYRLYYLYVPSTYHHFSILYSDANSWHVLIAHAK